MQAQDYSSQIENLQAELARAQEGLEFANHEVQRITNEQITWVEECNRIEAEIERLEAVKKMAAAEAALDEKLRQLRPLADMINQRSQELAEWIEQFNQLLQEIRKPPYNCPVEGTLDPDRIPLIAHKVGIKCFTLGDRKDAKRGLGLWQEIPELQPDAEPAGE